MSILEGLQDGKQPSFRYEYVNSIHLEIEKSDSISGLLKKITKYEIVNSDSCLSGAKVKACYAEDTTFSCITFRSHSVSNVSEENTFVATFCLLLTFSVITHCRSK